MDKSTKFGTQLPYGILNMDWSPTESFFSFGAANKLNITKIDIAWLPNILGKMWFQGKGLLKARQNYLHARKISQAVLMPHLIFIFSKQMKFHDALQA